MKAYVLIQTTSETDGIAGELLTVPGVISAEDLRGPYDAIALTSSDHAGHGLEAILDRLRRLPGITRAIVAPVVHASNPEGARAA